MDRQRFYLDYNATAPLRPQARDAMGAALASVGNPSSIHAEGRAARALVERAREEVAHLLGASPRAVTFTSGGTEAAALALTPGLATAPDGRPVERLIVAAVEHACVLKGHRFPADKVSVVPVDAHGALDRGALEQDLARGGAAMLALQMANNETGIVQDIPGISALVHAHGGFVVCDAVQGAGRIGIDLAAPGADAVFVSAHKLGGPKGIGALAFADERTHISDVMLRGGGQERGLRAGTENVAAIAGFGAACAALGDIEAEVVRLGRLRDELESGLLSVAGDAVVFGNDARRLPNTTAFAVAGMTAEAVLIALDLAGIAASSGSACSSGKVARSHVLEAMGVPAHLSRCAIRLSLGWASTARDVEAFVAAFAVVASNMRARHRAAA